MIFTTTIVFLAAIGLVSAHPAQVKQSFPTVTKSTPGCYIVSLETESGIVTAETCGPQEPLIKQTSDGCFSYTLGNEGGVLCPDGTTRSATSVEIKKRQILSFAFDELVRRQNLSRSEVRGQ